MSSYANLRAAQRNLSAKDIDYVLKQGNISYTADARIYFLRRADIPSSDRNAQGRLEGTAIIMASDRPVVITVWRNRQSGMKNIRRKLDRLAKYSRAS